MIKRIIPILLVAFIAFSCGKKKAEEVTQVKREVVKPPVEEKDTITPPPPAPEPVVVPKAENKYFLIAGSFSSMENAETFKNELIQQGFDSEVIIRKRGINQDFYKVSYKGFSDKDEAFNELAMERKQPNNQDVWLLIK